MRLTQLSTARSALFAGLAVAFTACADTGTGPAGADALLAVGEDLSRPASETFGSGMVASGAPLRDDRFEVSDDGGSNWKKAFVLTKNPRWITPITGTQWIGPRVDADNFFSIPLESDRYRTTFNIPANATNPVLNVRLWSDNAATVFVNGTQIGQQPQTDVYTNYGCKEPNPDMNCGNGNFANPDNDAFRYFTGPADPVVWNIGGVNTLVVVVLNAEFKQGCAAVGSPGCQSASGLDIRATVHFDVAPHGIVGCTPGFWQGKNNGALLWDTSPDAQWTANGGAGNPPFLHGTLFNSFFASHPTLNGLTMYDLVSTGGGPTAARKAARSLVAAYLNTAIGLNTGYTLVQLEQKWAAAVGSDAALNALHTELDAANNLGKCGLSVNR